MRVLLVDDDLGLANLLREFLEPYDVLLEHVESGAGALSILEKTSFDVALLDIMLPGGADGFEVCRQIRARFSIPIIMLTARGDDADRIVGLELGADDYVPKPFNPRELLARMRAVLRRARPSSNAPSSDENHAARHLRYVLGDLVVDVPAHHATLSGRDLQLTSFEFRVLVVLARKAGETVTREDLAREVKGGEYDPSVDRSLDVHVSHLRQKLEFDPRSPRWIHTVRGIGYVLSRPSLARDRDS